MLAGADGYRKRWVVALGHEDGSTRLELVDTFSELAARTDIELIVIDVPIGLPGQGPRTCDRMARRLLGPRRSSVFPAPLRSMLGARSYQEACERRQRVDGKGCSRQLFHILPLIKEVDEHMSPQQQRRIREGHPEVSFAALAGEPLHTSKARPEGKAARCALLRREFPDLDENVARLGRPGAITDILDAYVLLWSARRIARGHGQILPTEPEYDARGLRAEIVF
jgi:predicted RNase H-like nuclease